MSQRRASPKPQRLSSALSSLLACALLVACARPPAPASSPRAALQAARPAPPPRPQRGLPARDPAVAGVAVGVHGAVSSAEQNASQVGIAVLQRGGNAVDAAIAVAFALAVTHPTAGNLGGGGFMLVRMADGTATAIDYREAAPLAAAADMYLDAAGNVTRDSVLGPRAAGIAGTVAGMALAHRRFAKLAWAELVEPAVKLAREGHALDREHAEDLAHAVEAMRKAGFEDSARVYLGTEGAPLLEGQLWQQPELGATLETIATQGGGAFYSGPLAERIAQGVQKLGGLWTAEDLRRYRALERAPLVFDYRGHQILSMPPPSSGGIVLREILGASELLSLDKTPWRSTDGFHLYVEAARRAYADRNDLLGDPDFVKVPTQKLTSADYIRERMKDIDPLHATPSDRIKGGLLPAESTQTTHFSVVDDAGNAVSNTYTLNTSFGAKVVIPGTGILLNDEMDDFTAKPGAANTYGLVQSATNAIAPGKRMLSSMTPTIVVKDGQLRAVVGTPGGPTITNTVAQILRALLDYGRPLDDAVRAPRLHHQWLPDRITVEPSFEPEIAQELRARGHEVVQGNTFGQAECIEVDPATHGFRAVADVTRHYGAAAAY
jgi:gamma-glutamyltranspeptidase/glutathione hydrolase